MAVEWRNTAMRQSPCYTFTRLICDIRLGTGNQAVVKGGHGELRQGELPQSWHEREERIDGGGIGTWKRRHAVVPQLEYQQIGESSPVRAYRRGQVRG